jgi:hypothetical protein
LHRDVHAGIARRPSHKTRLSGNAPWFDSPEFDPPSPRHSSLQQAPLQCDCTFRHQASVSEGRVAPSFTLHLVKGQHAKTAKAFVGQIVDVPRAGHHRLHGSEALGERRNCGRRILAAVSFQRHKLSCEHQRFHDRDDLASAYQALVAAQNNNSPFAAYELGNLKGAFDRPGRAHPDRA